MDHTQRHTARATRYTIAALVVVVLVSVLAVAGAPHWFREGRAGLDHIVVPIVLFPLMCISTAFSLYAAQRRARAWTIVGVLSIVHAGLVAYGFVM
ncbi:MAG: hypothetical protein AAF500_20785 [Myxococcota bacterium]